MNREIVNKTAAEKSGMTIQEFQAKLFWVVLSLFIISTFVYVLV